jgi:type I site-specific restriction endonuclease
VDAQTCRLIVLDRAVGSMTEFKQIVGRGTRVHEDTKKFYFTLIDFRGATNFCGPQPRRPRCATRTRFSITQFQPELCLMEEV